MTQSNMQALWMRGQIYHDLPIQAEQALRNAGALYHNEDRARAELARAYTLAPNHLAVWVARYRFHFYRQQYAEAETCALECLRIVGATVNVHADISMVRPEHADFTSDDPRIRFMLFAWQAYGYLLLRLGREVQGIEIFVALAALDVNDITKTRALLAVIRARDNSADDS